MKTETNPAAVIPDLQFTSAHEAALLRMLYDLKGEVNRVFGSKCRVEINIMDVPMDKMKIISRSNRPAKISEHAVTIQSIAGRINITDDSMPF